jgi:hypothetical protein
MRQALAKVAVDSIVVGWFHRFGTRDGQQVTNEIALNPRHFQDRSTEETLSTLVHEMVHLRQHHFGTPSRASYHNREWARMMKEVGLYPSDTAQPGGKETGPRVSHYIVAGGAFERVGAEVIQSGCEIAYVEVWSDENGKAKAASKTKYACPSCGLNAWAKPEVLIMCAECRETMEAEQ